MMNKFRFQHLVENNGKGFQFKDNCCPHAMFLGQTSILPVKLEFFVAFYVLLSVISPL